MDPSEHDNDKRDEEAMVKGFMEAVDRVAGQSPAEQEAWLRTLSEVLGDMPDRAQAIEQMRDYMIACREAHVAERRAFVTECRLQHCTEQNETLWINFFDELLRGERKLSRDPLRRAHFLLHLLGWGHLLPGLHERLTQPEGVAYLMTLLKEHPLEAEPE